MDTQDIVDIQQLEALCHHAVDHHDQSMFPLVFTADARFDGRLCGGPLHEGLEAIMAYFALGKPPHPPTHHMTNCWVHEEAGQVRVKSKWMCPYPSTGLMYVGDNDDVVVRTADGWRIKERVASLRYPTGEYVDSA